MKISDRALNFAMMAHYGQVRKSEPDKPVIFHPMIVGSILKYYGYDDNVVAAGYLHDVVEDTKYTNDDIARLFGGDIASLVMTASEPDKNESWEERKRHTIKTSKDLPERNKAIICADKIANLEDILILTKKTGYEDFSLFKRGKEDQKWYFQSVFEALSHDFDSPMLDRLYNDIEKVFFEPDNLYTKEYFYKNNAKEYKRLVSLEGYSEELTKLKTILGDTKPYIIEFTGTSKSGKSSMITMLSDFFDSKGFKIKVLEDSETTGKFNTEFVPDKNSLTPVEKNLLISSTIESEMVKNLSNNHDIILIERGLFDKLTWMQFLVNMGYCTEENFKLYFEHYATVIEVLTNHIFIPICNPLTSVKRDYKSHLQLSTDLSEFDVNAYNEALKQCLSLISGYGTILDTSEISSREATIRIAETLLPIMRNEYVKQLKLFIEEKKDKTI